MTPVEASNFLKERATSYWRDAQKMDGDETLSAMAVAYRTIARELRDCAKGLSDG